MKLDRGFSLLEVVIGVTILGLIIGCSMPYLMTYYHWLEFQGTVNQLISNAHFARQQSVKETEKWGLIFLPGRGEYWLVKGKPRPQVKKRVDLGENINYKKVTFPVYQESYRAVFFKSLGNLDTPNGKVVLQWRNRQKKIVFSSNAGDINVR